MHGKSSNSASRSGWSGRHCQTSTDLNPVRSFSCPSYQVRGISFELFPRPWHTVAPVSSPFRCADSSLRRVWNTTQRRLGLGPDRTESYPLLAVRKLAPTVAGDHRDDVESGPSFAHSGFCMYPFCYLKLSSLQLNEAGHTSFCGWHAHQSQSPVTPNYRQNIT